jgi:ubiquinone/menaquinone biosynthesis C-methylase UbiE
MSSAGEEARAEAQAQQVAQQAALRAAQMYDQYHVKHMFHPWSQVLLEHAALCSGERVLDLACGTGIVAREAAGRVGPSGRVAALDINPAMLAVARTHAAAPGAPDIEWTQGSAQNLPFPDASFDVVLCQQGFQFFPDRDQASAQVRRVLVPGGRVLLLVSQGIGRNPLYDHLNRAMLARTGIPAYATPFALGEAGQLETLLMAAGFQQITVQEASLDVNFPEPQHFVTLSVQGAAAALPHWAALPESERAALSQGIQHDVADWTLAHTSGGQLHDTMLAYIARALK